MFLSSTHQEKESVGGLYPYITFWEGDPVTTLLYGNSRMPLPLHLSVLSFCLQNNDNDDVVTS